MNFLISIFAFLNPFLTLLADASTSSTSGYEIGYKIGELIGSNLQLILVFGILIGGLAVFLVVKNPKEKSRSI